MKEVINYTILKNKKIVCKDYSLRISLLAFQAQDHISGLKVNQICSIKATAAFLKNINLRLRRFDYNKEISAKIIHNKHMSLSMYIKT